MNKKEMPDAIERMHEMIEKLFCLPCDRDNVRTALPLQVGFEYVVGNRTVVPAKYSTGWRTMPFHLCCTRATECEGISAVVEFKDKPPLEARSRDIIFIPAGVPHRINDLPDTISGVSLWMHFFFRTMSVLDVLDYYELPNIIPAAKSAEISSYLEQLVALPHVLDFGDSVNQQVLGAGFCAALLRFGKLKPEKGRDIDKNLNRCLPVMQLLANTIKMPPVETLARSIYLSNSRFLAIFRSVTGMSPGQYFEHERYLKACLLLSRDELTISEISERLGYYSAFHFSRKFKTQSGLPPNVYRKMHHPGNG